MGKFDKVTVTLHGFLLMVIAAPAAFAGTARHADAPRAVHQTIQPAGTQASQQGPETYFTGRVRVDPLTKVSDESNVSSAYVTFEPGAHSAWHIHPKGQHLIVTAGEGLTQEWGQPVRELRVGDVVWCPPGVKHWHGASSGSAMTHLALTGASNGQSVTWMEKVSDEQYRSR